MGGCLKWVFILVCIGALEQETDSKWLVPLFVKTKQKTNIVQFISDFVNFNRQLKFKPYPMRKINETLLKL